VEFIAAGRVGEGLAHDQWVPGREAAVERGVFEDEVARRQDAKLLDLTSFPRALCRSRVSRDSALVVRISRKRARTSTEPVWSRASRRFMTQDVVARSDR